MILPDRIYWDLFKEEYCLEKDEISPPERYLETYKCSNGMFIEHWEVTGNSEGNRLNIAFAEDEYKGDLKLLIIKRQYYFEKNHCRPVQMIRFGIPEHLFKKYCLRILGEERKE